MFARDWRLTVFAVGLSGALSCFAEAQLFKWVDSRGRVHYSDSLPEGVQALDFSPPAANAIAPPLKKRAARHDKSKGKKVRAKKRTKKRVSCEKFQRRIDSIQKQLRAGYREPKGNKLRARRRALSEQLKRCRNS